MTELEQYRFRQAGFGEAYLFPVILCLAACGYILFPGFSKLFSGGITISVLSLLVISVLCSIGLATQLFGDYLNLLLVVVFAIFWNITDAGLIELLANENGLILFNNTYLVVVIPTFYFLSHAVILKVFKLVKNKTST